MEQNILILNAGTRNKVVQYFKEVFAGKGKVIVSDSYRLAPALYEGDGFYVTRWCTQEGYLEEILEIVRKERIKGIISLLDPDLPVIAEHKKLLEKEGVMCFISDAEVIENCFDKYKTSRLLEKKGFYTAKTFCCMADFREAYGKKEIAFPVYCKPTKGSGSAGIEKVATMERLSEIMSGQESYIVQEYMAGQEIGADVYVDRISHRPVAMFTKKKLKMRSGETDKSISFKNEKLFQILEELTVSFGLEGPVDIDVFEEEGRFYVSEINPRFGGGYIHAYECGVNFPEAILCNMEGRENGRRIGEYEENVVMMKYFDALVRKIQDERKDSVEEG